MFIRLPFYKNNLLYNRTRYITVTPTKELENNGFKEIQKVIFY